VVAGQKTGHCDARLIWVDQRRGTSSFRPFLRSRSQMDPLTDRELMEQCAGGDPLAVRELIIRHEGSLRGFLTRLVTDPEDVEEALGEVFVRLWRMASRYRGECAVTSLLHRIAVTTGADVLRKRRRRRQVTCVPLSQVPELPGRAGDQPETALMAGYRQQWCEAAVRRALDELPAVERIPIALFYLENHSYQEIAEITQVPVTTVRMRLWRARRRMRSLIQAWMDQDERPQSAEVAPLKPDLAKCCGDAGW